MSSPKEVVKTTRQVAVPKDVVPVVEKVTGNGMSSNEKRIKSCQKVGGEKKRIGHERENEFKAKYNPTSLSQKTEYGATSDTMIDENHPICTKLKEVLGCDTFYCSNKSGYNIQMTLGRIPELDVVDNLQVLMDKAKCHQIFEKYLKKNQSKKPADLLVYKDLIHKKWLFFSMNDIINFIVDNVIWRKLKSKRIKGDFVNKSGKLIQYITYEYRGSSHKSYFLGMNCGKGAKFIELLTHKIKYIADDI